MILMFSLSVPNLALYYKYKIIPIINPNTIPMEEPLPEYRFFAFGIISSHIIYSIVPPAKERHRDINVLEIMPI